MASEPTRHSSKVKFPKEFLTTKWMSSVKDCCDEHDNVVVDDDVREGTPCNFAMVSFIDGQSRTTGDIGIVPMSGLKLRNSVTGAAVTVNPKEVILFPNEWYSIHSHSVSKLLMYWHFWYLRTFLILKKLVTILFINKHLRLTGKTVEHFIQKILVHVKNLEVEI